MYQKNKSPATRDLEDLKQSGKSNFVKLLFKRYYAEIVFLPLLRLLANMALPLAVDIRLKKPCLFFRFRLLILTVIFITPYPF